MKTNQTPFNDQSENTTGSCPRCNAKGWDSQTFHFKDKPFVRATTHAVVHLPINMGKMDTGHAVDPEQSIVMSRNLSAFTGEHLFAVTADVSGEERMTLSGDYLTKVFEDRYSNARRWHAELQELAKQRAAQQNRSVSITRLARNAPKSMARIRLWGLSNLALPPSGIGCCAW